MTQNDVDPALSARPLAEGDMYAAVRGFVLTFALPPLNPDQVIQGWQNRAALPEGSDDLAVISVLASSRHGTTVENFSAPDPDPEILGRLDVRALTKVAVQVDFHSSDDSARLRAQRVAVLARSAPALSFFQRHGMSILYADDVEEREFKGDARQFVRRYSVTLHLSLWCGEILEVPYFDRTSLARCENVDEHHVPFSPLNRR